MPGERMTTRTVVANCGPHISTDREATATITFSIATENFAHGTFGSVYSGHLLQTPGGPSETIAIKKVLQDPQFRNRELEIIRELVHPHVIELKYYFFERISDQRYLFLLMEHMPDSLHRIIRRFREGGRYTPMIFVRVILFQIFRSLAYIHGLNICHRDIKPHNIMIDPKTALTKLIDFGSSKILASGETNVSYICSRFYRAPDLILGRDNYGFDVDIWAAGCVMGELIMNRVLFLGENRSDQIAQIIKILGTPTKTELMAMNPEYADLTLPYTPKKEWSDVFHRHCPEEAFRLIARLLTYSPLQRSTAFEALADDFFLPLRTTNRLPGDVPLPDLFNWTQNEMRNIPAKLWPRLIEGK